MIYLGILVMIVLVIFIAGCTYAYNPNFGEGICYRFVAAFMLAMVSMVVINYAPMGNSVETAFSLREKVSRCQPNVECIIVINFDKKD